MTGIVTYQRCLLTSGMGSDHHIHGADGRAVLFQCSTNLSIMVRRCFVPEDYGQPGDKIVYLFPDGRSLLMACRAIVKLGQNNRGNAKISCPNLLKMGLD